MKKPFEKFKFLFFIIILFGCTKGQKAIEIALPEENVTKFENKVELVKTGEYVIEIDSTLGFFNQSLSFLDSKEDPRLSILGVASNRIHIFNYQTGKEEFNIQLEREGDNGIGNVSNMGHLYHSPDSIFLFNHWDKKIHLMSNEGKLRRTYKIETTNLGFEFYFIVNPSSPAIIDGDYLYLICNTLNIDSKFSEANILFRLNLKSDDQDWFVSPSEILEKGFWGPMTPYTNTMSINQKKREIAINNYKDPEVRFFDLDDPGQQKGSKISGYSLTPVLSSIPKLSNEPPYFGYEFMEASAMSNISHLFISLIYDPYRDLYYRIYIDNRSEEEYRKNIKGIELIVLILDSDFNKIGESKLPKGNYAIDFFFVSEKGLHLPNILNYEKNEDQMLFDIYQPRSK